MPYVCVRGTLGMANTRVYGLNETEAEKITTILRVAEVFNLFNISN